MSKSRCKGVIFDLDGVVTGTARVHALAWESAFNEFLKEDAERENRPYMPFDKSDDYLRFVDGKPRFEGVKSFLKSRGIQLPFGDVDDSPDQGTVCALGNKKNEQFQEILRREGPEVFHSTVEFIQNLKARGIRVAVASSSRNCELILQLAKLEELFEARVDGVVSQERKLIGKPHPDIFVTAAADVGLLPGECAVVEDAISGVQAGRYGNFGLTLGIARAIDGSLLRRFGADIVVRDLAEFSVDDLEAWFSRGIEDDGWNLGYIGLDPGDEKLRETLCTVGNGYLGTRGCFEGEKASFSFYPGTYIAGVFNKLPSVVHDREIFNNDFVNCPNWLPIRFRVGSGEFVSPLSMELLSYSQTLHMREGMLERVILCKDGLGRITRIRSRRFASMADPHLCALSYDLTPVNYSSPITVRSSLDGNVINEGVPRYKALNSNHLSLVDSGSARGSGGNAPDDGVFLQVETNQSGYRIAMQARTRLLLRGKPLAVSRNVFQEEAEVGEELHFHAEENATYVVEKVVAICTSLDDRSRWAANVADPGEAAQAALTGAGSFDRLFAPHVKAWQRLWDKADVQIVGDRFTQQTIRLHVYHLLVTASPHNKHMDAGMPARGLHGEGYRGHIFWDELYIQPFFLHHFPEIARALLMYRYRRLDAARAYARQNGYAGAMYPWQTADDGGEETQELHYNPENDKWGPDLSRRQRHVSIAVFYNVWKYVDCSGDKRFLREYGAEIMLEIARFWADIATRDPETGRFHIEGVMGPDEFHEKRLGADEPGVRDNAYTNLMVVWLLSRALEVVRDLPKATLAELQRKTGFDLVETENWRKIVRKMNVVVTPEGIISQFDGYMELKELDWAFYRRRYYSIHRMDRILKAENDSPDKYKVAKQADVLMLFYVLPPEEIRRMLVELGYEVPEAGELLKRNYQYYEKRTSHGSTLSKVVHSVLSSYAGNGGESWTWFSETMRSDVQDTQGGTTIEGIHTGVMAGTLDVVVRHFAGVDFTGREKHITPHLPAHWSFLGFKLLCHGLWFHLEISRDSVRILVEGKSAGSVPFRVGSKSLDIPVGEWREVALQ